MKNNELALDYGFADFDLEEVFSSAKSQSLKGPIIIESEEETVHESAPEQPEVFNFGLEVQGELACKKTDGIEYNVGQISNDVTKAQLLMTNPSTAKKILQRKGFFCDEFSEKPYTPVPMNGNVVEMSYDIEKEMYERARKSSYSEKSVKLFLSDYCKVGRMRQELTIDYAKHLTDLSGISNLMFKKIEASGMREHSISYEPRREDKITIKSKTAREIYNETNKFAFDDSIHELSNMCLNFASKRVVGEKGIIEYLDKFREKNAEDYRLVKMNEQLANCSLNPVIMKAKDIYKDAVASFGGDHSHNFVLDDEEDFDESDVRFNDVIARLENMIRIGTAEMSPIERAIAIKKASSNKEGTYECKLYLQICKEEYLLWLHSLGFSAFDFIGERIYCETDDTQCLPKEGDTIQFENGCCITDGLSVYIDSNFTGTLEVFKKNGILYAGKKIEDAITVPEPELNITVPVINSFFGNRTAAESVREINSRLSNKTALRYDKESRGYVLIMKMKEDTKEEGAILKVPVFIRTEIASKLTKEHVGHIVGTRINTVKNKNGFDIPVVYIDVDFD